MDAKEGKKHTLTNKIALNPGLETGIWWMNECKWPIGGNKIHNG